LCGIAGIFARDGSKKYNAPRPLEVWRSIDHRGPDGKGYFTDSSEQVHLYHTRLSLVDLSASGDQPMVDDETGVVIIFNGEVYNFRELRAALIIAGKKFKSKTDTEVILHLYNCHGRSMLGMLDGMFSIAIWDPQKQSLLLARDGLGIKPLYFFESDDGFAFASEIKSIKCFTAVNGVDCLAIKNYLTYQWCPGEQTAFHGVKKVGPGELLEISKGRINERRQWYVNPLLKPALSSKTVPELRFSLQKTIKSSVTKQIAADAEIGVFLSGGLDSSLIAALASEEKPDIRCLTIRPLGDQEEGFVEDIGYAKKVAKHLDVDLEVIEVDEDMLVDGLEHMVYHLDEPIADPAAFNLYLMCVKAREIGLKGMLSGVGGDDVFSGYRRHQALYYSSMIDCFPVYARNLLGEIPTWGLAKSILPRRALKFLKSYDDNINQRLINYFHWADTTTIDSLFTKDFQSAAENSVSTDTMGSFLEGLDNSLDHLTKALLLEQRFFLGDHNLIYTDKMSMAAGIEVRVPFLDQDLLKLASTIPSEYKQSRSCGKWILKQVALNYLPNSIVNRPKSGLGLPIRSWFKGKMYQQMSDIFGSKSFSERGVFNVSQIQKMLKLQRDGHEDFSYCLFSILINELWFRNFMNKKNKSYSWKVS